MTPLQIAKLVTREVGLKGQIKQKILILNL